MVDIDIIGLLDELKEVKETKVFNTSYSSITQRRMVEEPHIIIEGYWYKIFHCDTSVVLELQILGDYFSLETVSKIHEVCKKYSENVTINLIEKKISIRWKR